MATKKLIKSVIDGLTCPEGKTEVYVFDTDLKGFGIRVCPGGSKTFMVQARVNGTKRRITLGKYGPMTPEQARKRAKEELGLMAGGVDPKAGKAEAEKLETTLWQAYQQYIEARKADGGLRPKTLSVYESALRRCFPDWLDRPVAKITRDDVISRFRELATTQGPRSKEGGAKAQASQAMRVLRTVLNFTHDSFEDEEGNSLMPANPVKKLTQVHRGWNKVSRKEDDVIIPTALKPWYEAVAALPNATMSHFLLFCLFTGLRRSAASTLRWDHVNFNANTITIPDTIDKTGRAQTIPMSDYVKALLESRVRVLHNPYVFTGDKDGECMQEPKRAIAKVIDKSGVKFSCHTLRKTFATVAERLDISKYKLKQLLNHSTGDDVTSNHYIYIDVEQLREPMQLITNYLLDQINRPATKEEQELAEAKQA